MEKEEHMKISVIIGHPYSKSFNAALAEKTTETLKKRGHEVFFHDLYRENFNPVLSPEELAGQDGGDELVRIHRKEIKEADGIVLIHPEWWGQPPAVLKGWVDRVLVPGTAYETTMTENGSVTKGLLKAETVILFATSNTPAEREEGVLGDPLLHIWRDCTFSFCSKAVFDRIMFRVIETSSAGERKQWLEDAAGMLEKYF